MLFTAKCYWPGLDDDQLEHATARLGRGASRRGVTYLGSVVFAEDELVLCLFEAPSRAAVKQASERAGLPCERVIDTTWIASPNTTALLDHARR
jgi:hypothetical protein